MRSIIWFREDLRVHDNTALYHASQQSEELIAVYILDKTMLQAHEVAACRVSFTLRGLAQLKLQLSHYHIPLLLLEVRHTSDVANTLLELMRRLSANSLFFNKQYEINESRRDDAVARCLQDQHLGCTRYDDQVILAPNSVISKNGECYKVFTAFKRAWVKQFQQLGMPSPWPLPSIQAPINITSSDIPVSITDFETAIDASLWPAGEMVALHKLQDFIENNLFLYEKQRDFPAISGTSQLSPYLASGMISARHCIHAALTANNDQLDSGNKGAQVWITELIWREFYKHLLVLVPRISMGQAYKQSTNNIKWNFEPTLLTAWQQGMTGYPMIDAAMRQLNSSGWMHNRLRMIVAMFFTKNLFFDWRLGEQYFMQHLIDGDLAANNGGWQWCASTGTDAAPYFRVFNPVTQSQRFDPQGQFIRTFCPELSSFDDKAIHHPHLLNPTLARQVHYPSPIVDLASTRRYAIEAFKQHS